MERGAWSGERGAQKTNPIMAQFRFEGMAIRPPARRGLLSRGQKACDVGEALCDVADELEGKRLYRFAEQLRGAALSISNNIAGSAP